MLQIGGYNHQDHIRNKIYYDYVIQNSHSLKGLIKAMFPLPNGSGILCNLSLWQARIGEGIFKFENSFPNLQNSFPNPGMS